MYCDFERKSNALMASKRPPARRERIRVFGSAERERLVRTAIQVVAEAEALTRDFCRSRSRSRPMVRARHLTLYLCHVIGELSIRQLARIFNRDRQTIRHAIGRIEDLRDDAAFDSKVENMSRAMLNTPPLHRG